MPQNPIGNFKIQVASSSAFVTASAANTNLIASTSSSGGATVFKSGYIPNSGTLQLPSTGQYVTADKSGDSTLAASRGSAADWERFIIRPKNGAGAEVYTIKAASNGLYVTVDGNGALKNNGKNEGAGTGFRFVAA